MAKFHTIYKITNKLNGKVYIGAHSTDDIEDSYFGSGVHLKEDLLLYGIKNFTKEILHVFDTSNEMYQMESQYVTREFVDSDNTYNLKLGSHGGWDHLAGKPLSNDHKEKIRKANLGKTLSDEHRQKLKNANLGKKHTLETKEKMSVIHKGRIFSDDHRKNLSGKNNVNFGTMCITNGSDNSRILKTDSIPDGWYKGRTVSNNTRQKMSDRLKGNNHPAFGRKWINDGIHNKLILNSDDIPNGWVLGMIIKKA